MAWAKDKWFGEDKLTHAAWCYGLTLTLLLAGAAAPWAVVCVAWAGFCVELVQWVRYSNWEWEVRLQDSEDPWAVQQPVPLPAFASPPSYRDLVWDGIGLLLGLTVAEVLL